MNRKANGMIIGVVIGIVVLGVLGYFGSQLLRTTPKSTVIPTPPINKADIDRSGAADEGDRMLVRNNIGCEKINPCWNATIGKTKDGDNPLYVFDLDLDADGLISQKDVDAVK